jgi:hypothetical protein
MPGMVLDVTRHSIMYGAALPCVITRMGLWSYMVSSLEEYVSLALCNHDYLLSSSGYYRIYPFHLFAILQKMKCAYMQENTKFIIYSSRHLCILIK